MDRFIKDLENITQDFYTSVLESKEAVLEDAIQKSNVGWDLCNNKKELTDYSLYWNLDISNTKGIITVEKIIRNLFPEKRSGKSYSQDSKELRETLAVLREREHTTGYRPSTKNIYTNFIYAKPGNNLDTDYQFRFGRITKENYRLMEDGSKHIQMCNGYSLLYSGTMIFTRYNDSTLQININANSGRWLKIMEFLLTDKEHKLPDSFWSFLPNPDKIPSKVLSGIKHEILSIILIKCVEKYFQDHFLETLKKYGLSLKIFHCSNESMFRIYNYLRRDMKCSLDIGKHLINLEENTKKRRK